MYYPDGSKYEGSWSDNVKNGYGIYYYINGDTYEGDWLNNKKDGQGIYSYAETGTVVLFVIIQTFHLRVRLLPLASVSAILGLGHSPITLF